jgi:hypothetical protein
MPDVKNAVYVSLHPDFVDRDRVQFDCRIVATSRRRHPHLLGDDGRAVEGTTELKIVICID